MNKTPYKIQKILVLLYASIFSMLLILLSLTVPMKKEIKHIQFKEKSKNILEDISRNIQK